MNTIESCRVELSRTFGTRIEYGKPALPEAVEWLAATLNGKRRHTELKVQTCQTAPLQPTGNARVDQMLKADFQAGFASGNTYSNLQSSSMLPPRGQKEVNGFTVIDGRELITGYLQERALSTIEMSSWNDSRDREVLREIKAIIRELPLETGCTVSRIMHLRSKDTRYDQPCPAHKHGWLVVDDRNTLLYRYDFAASGVGLKLMDRAQQVLTCEHTDPVSLLEITGGRITKVDNSVLQGLAQTGEVFTGQQVEDFVIDPRQPWDVERVADTEEENAVEGDVPGG